MPKAYSYARWSSVQQGRGDSLRRQLKLSREYAAEHGLDLDESFRDAGVSAYRGKNRVEGALGNFIKQIDSGKIEPGSYLLIESIDRLSREEVLVALELFISIIRRDVKIVTLLDKQVFDREQLNKNVGLLFMSIGVMQRAHEESRTKGERVANANENKRQRARENNVPMTALCPGWLSLVKTGRGYEHARYEIIPERAAVVRRIYLECIAGLGKRRIAERLNWDALRLKRDDLKPFRGKDGWHQSSISKILSTEAVLGTYQPHRKVDGKRIPDGPPIIGYFPAIIDEATYWQAQEAIKGRQHRSAGRKGETHTNLFSGLGTCGVCQKGKLRLVDKGPPPKGAKYLTCERSLRGLCENKGLFRYDKLEDVLIKQPGIQGMLVPEIPVQNGNAPRARVAELEARAARLTDARQRFLREFRDVDDPMVLGAIRSLGTELKDTERELVEARRAAKIVEHADRRDYIERLSEAQDQLASNDRDERLLARSRLAQHFNDTIHHLVLDKGGRKMTVQMQSPHGAVTTYEITPDGLESTRMAYPDGHSVRMAHRVWQAAAAPVLVGLRDRIEALFMDRETRPALSEIEFLERTLLPQEVMKRMALREITPGEYEVVLADGFPPLVVGAAD